MDQIVLVNEQVDAGRRLLDQVDGQISIRAAFWLKKPDERDWYLYVAAGGVTDANIGRVFGPLAQAARRMGDPNLDPFRINVISADAPLARAVVELLERYPGPFAIRPNDSLLGDVEIDGAYIYPRRVAAPAAH